MSIERLLQATVRNGGRELRLFPGRRIVIVTSAGEREVQGAVQSAASIHNLLAPVLTSEARDALGAGRGEWQIEVAEVGPVAAWAESGPGGVSAGFEIGGGRAPSEVPVPVAQPVPAPRPSGPTAEIEELLSLLFGMNASDLHLAVGSPALVRHDGEIKPLPGRPVLTAADTERILLPMAPKRNREEFERRHDTDFAYEIAGLARFRCNFFMDRKGMGGVFRVIPAKILTAEEMGLSREILQLCDLPKGLVLVTGPTGSGKSTTLCALIDYINRRRTDHIITIEDPIEFVHENKKCLINQRQVGEHTDSFKGALRAALREDPDIVLVGEMRDLETIAIAIETAETGHLVFGTLHTSSAPSTVDRIIDQFPADRQGQIRVMLAESLKAVISQTLCKKIGGGRIPVMEVLIGTPPVSNLIREAKIFQIPSIMQTSRKYGMCLLNESFTELVRKRVVDPQEAYAKALDKSGLLNQFRKNGIDTSWAPAET
ncbi:MAG TPA: type IV pilus twitching motility protein PilT [Vicinamibacteria bacterium]|nr:type IV pilus twitching motility protein PilT [Vicinamibacteria bacterium]